MEVVIRKSMSDKCVKLRVREPAPANTGKLETLQLLQFTGLCLSVTFLTLPILPNLRPRAPSRRSSVAFRRPEVGKQVQVVDLDVVVNDSDQQLPDVEHLDVVVRDPDQKLPGGVEHALRFPWS